MQKTLQTFDTVKLKAHFDCIDNFNPTHFRVTPWNNKKGSGFEIDTKDILGLSSISTNELIEQVTLTFSSKILKAKYDQLINCNTIQEAIENINTENEAITFNPEKLIEQGQALSVDATKDLEFPGYSIRDVLDTVGLNSAKGYTVVDYQNGINIKSIAKSNNFLLKAYDKHYDLMLAKNRPLLQYIDPYQYKNKTRFELCIRSFPHIRKSFNIPKTTGTATLQQLLESTTAPILSYWNKFINPDPNLFDDLPQGDWQGIKKIILAQGICSRCNNDETLIFKFLTGYAGMIRTNAYKFIRDEVRPVLNNTRNQIKPKYAEIMELIPQALI